ncbi:MAG: GTP 3',8-cyclase MoaA [Bacillota bacterium]
MKKLVDDFGRRIDYLRISVTDRCNLRCQYCMPADGISLKEHEDILELEEIAKIAEVGKELGIKKIRLTGGEPLVRLGIEDLISSLDKIAFEDISMTTNGVLLSKKADDLKKAGLDRVNISLDTLDKDKYKVITRRDHFDDVMSGIKTALDYDFSPVKLNVVVIKGFNDEELLDFAKLSKDRELHVRFIEYMPLGGEVEKEKYINMKEVKEKLISKLSLLKTSTKGNGPAKYYKIPKSKGSIGFISAISEHFCSECNRFRLTADGKFRPCLARDMEVKIDDLSKKGIEKAYKKSLEIKPMSHNLNFEVAKERERTMSQIGG